MRKWLEKYYREYLGAVRNLTPADRETAEEWAEWMRQSWDANGKAAITQQKDLLREVRAALKHDLVEDHIALETMNFSTSEWIHANRPSNQRAAAQNAEQRVLTPGTVNAIVTRAVNLLSSREWYDIAAGLAVLTGRRSTEILKTATFTPKTEFSVCFTGALKRKGEETPITFEIPTLCRAKYALKAMKKLRDIANTTSMTETQVNTRYSESVAKACDRHFADLVEPPEGKTNLYTHLFRKIYATIATYYYCPPTVDEAEFRAEIQGHFSGHEDLSLAERRSIASDRFYRSYVILDDDRRTAKGIHLNWQGVEVLETFQNTHDQPHQVMITVNPIEHPESDTMRIENSLFDRLNTVLSKLGEDGAETLLNWLESNIDGGNPTLLRHDAQQDSTPAPQPQPEKSTQDAIAQLREEQARAIAQLREEMDALKNGFSREAGGDRSLLARIAGLEQENTALAEEIAALKVERDQAIAKLNQFRALLDGNAGESEQLEPVIAPQPTPYSPIHLSAQAPVRPSALKGLVLDPDVLRALETIMTYNDNCSNHSQKWAISYPVMKDLLACIGKATQTKIKAVFDAYAQQIEEHHAKHGLGGRHNRIHKGESITSVINFQ
jgi:hypothetical protein